MLDNIKFNKLTIFTGNNTKKLTEIYVNIDEDAIRIQRPLIFHDNYAINHFIEDMLTTHNTTLWFPEAYMTHRQQCYMFDVIADKVMNEDGNIILFTNSDIIAQQLNNCIVAHKLIVLGRELPVKQQILNGELVTLYQVEDDIKEVERTLYGFVFHEINKFLIEFADIAYKLQELTEDE